MSAWITITTTNLRDTKASALIDAFQTSALGTGQTDPVPRVINAVANRIRAEIQSSGEYSVSATAYAIPPSLFSMAARMIAWDLQSRLNVQNSMPPSDQDVQDHRDDLRYLERIARGEVTIEAPADPLASPDTQIGGGEIEIIGDRPIKNTREALSRL